ncbi:VOC family protein [Streptomyces kaniharaensis]|uniref:VOC family protein n=1 Tax=Streptomyces kaniharaensis TaxID=212423 RepID=A0A6N7KJQ9_9ACTN|nr:VOC family protein [Streptomyces kaniharaensis]MQS11666.1 VOC family protein [Streptomyces kaniharaensis]
MEIPEHHKRTVIPHIFVDGAAEAIRFYQAAFDASELFRLAGDGDGDRDGGDGDDGGRIVHAEIVIHGATLMLSDAHLDPFAPPAAAAGASVALHVYVPDVDALTVQAVTAGAQLLSPPADMPYGARQSMLRDPFGHVWIFLTPLPAA